VRRVEGRGPLGRAAVVALCAVALLTALAPPALAHGRGSDATNFRSEILAAPAIEGVTWRIYGGDEMLGLSNTSTEEVLVLGYRDEPYLRVGPDGVFENMRSPATFLNRERYLTDAPPQADPDAEPQWEQVSDDTSYAWHDHRIHWMSPTLPPTVTDPGQEALIQEWAVDFVVGSEMSETSAPAQVSGELRWVPGPSPWPWLGVGLLLSLAALAGVRTSSSDDRWPGLARPAAIVLAAIAVLNLTHLVDDFLAVPMPLSSVLLSAFQTALFIGIGFFGAIRGWQAQEGAFTALGVGAGAMFVGQGLLYLSVLSASQVASVFPVEVARLAVAVSLMQVLPIGAVAVIGTRRLLPEYEPPPVSETAA
jgi:hypothetical protein